MAGRWTPCSIAQRGSPAVVLCVLMVACGGDDNGSSTTGSSVSGTTTSSTSTTDPAGQCVTILEHGCSGEPVERLQRLLRSAVVADLVVDGDFGTQTATGLRRFEEQLCSVCEVDETIEIDGPEWAVLIALPPITTTTDEIEPSP